MFIFPHGATVDPQGNLWVTDEQMKDGTGMQVFKFSPEGKVLMTLGKAGVASADPGLFDEPTDVAIAPNGDIFVSEGHSGPRHGNDRISKFTPDGKFIKSWGKRGSGNDELNAPHTLAFDSQGRLFVGDRNNNRIQIFDPDGHYLDTWRQWVVAWTPPAPGAYRLRVRATDAAGNVQTEQASDVFPSGATGLHTVTVRAR